MIDLRPFDNYLILALGLLVNRETFFIIFGVLLARFDHNLYF